MFWLFSIWSALLQFPLFLIASFVSFFLPGFFSLRGVFKKSSLSLFLSALVSGIVLWGIQGYILGYLHIRFLTYLYVLFFIFFGTIHWKVLKNFFTTCWNELLLLNKKLFFIIFLGVIVQLIPVVGSGIKLPDGIHFYSINGTDGIMHLAYIQSITHAFPPMEPGARGDLITNYHYWSDLVVSEISRIWLLSIPHLYFRFFPLLIAILTGILTYFVIRQLKGGNTAGLIGVFLIYFSGDAPFIFSLIHKNLGFGTPAIDNGALQFINMPHAMARMLFIGGLMVCIEWLQNKGKNALIVSLIIFACLIGFKIYFGLFTALGISLLFISIFIKKLLSKHTKNTLYTIGVLLLIGIGFFLIQAAIFLPPNKSAGGLYFSALDWVRLLLGAGGVNLTQWWTLYRLSMAHNIPIATFFLNIIGILFSLIIIYGTRVLGFFPSKNIRNLPWEVKVFLIPGIIVFNILGLFTLQVSGGLNVFNFFSVATIPLTIFAALVLEDIIESKSRFSMLIIVCFILLTIPRAIYEDGFSFYRYTTNVDSYFVPNAQLSALMYIREHGNKGTLVQSHPKNHWDMRAPYVAFFTDHDTYLSGVGIQDTHNQPIGERKVQLKIIFDAPNSYDFRTKLIQHNISYFFWIKDNEETFQYELTHGHFFYLYDKDGVAVLSPNKNS